jgi:hypothetical protein
LPAGGDTGGSAAPGCAIVIAIGRAVVAVGAELGRGGGERGCCERRGGDGVLHCSGVVGRCEEKGIVVGLEGVLLGLIAKTGEMEMQDNKRKPSSNKWTASRLDIVLTAALKQEVDDHSMSALSGACSLTCRRIRAAGNASPP